MSGDKETVAWLGFFFFWEGGNPGRVITITTSNRKYELKKSQ